MLPEIDNGEPAGLGFIGANAELVFPRLLVPGVEYGLVATVLNIGATTGLNIALSELNIEEPGLNDEEAPELKSGRVAELSDPKDGDVFLESLYCLNVLSKLLLEPVSSSKSLLISQWVFFSIQHCTLLDEKGQ